MSLNNTIQAATQYIQSQKPDFKPTIAVILGSGLADVADIVENPTVVSYKDIPGFPIPTVENHAGKLIMGRIGSADALLFQGRVHYYEGDVTVKLKIMIRTIKSLGVETLFLTNASGSLNWESPIGSVVCITDHINMLGRNPLVGENDDDWGPRFVPLDNAWDKDLRAKLHIAAAEANVPMRDGVFAAMLGPTFESHAEIHMLRTMGADTVAMSTVPECILARHCGLKVIGTSTVTNMAAGMEDVILSHDDISANSRTICGSIQKLLEAFLK